MSVIWPEYLDFSRSVFWFAMPRTLLKTMNDSQPFLRLEDELSEVDFVSPSNLSTV